MSDPIRADQFDPAPADLGRVADRFGVGPLTKLGGFENILYRSEDGRILRLTHTSRRSVADVEAEVAFMQHLAAHDVPVVAPIPSASSHLVEHLTLGDGNEVVAYCMTEAPGEILNPKDWSDEWLVALGDLLGRAHVAAASYEGPRRPSWTEDFFDPGTAKCPDAEIVEAWRTARDQAADHAAGGDHLLIHQDAHFWNQHVDDGRLTLFDFDDCGYGTPEHDLAIVLFYWAFDFDATNTGVRRLLDNLFEGYHRHAALIEDWREGFDRIMKVREADLFMIMVNEQDDWGTGWLTDGRRQRVLDGTPFLERPLADLV